MEYRHALLSLNFIELFRQTGKGRVSRLAFPTSQISCQLFKLTGLMEILGAASFPGRGILSNIWKLATELLEDCASSFGDIRITTRVNFCYPVEIRELSASGNYYILPTHLSDQRFIGCRKDISSILEKLLAPSLNRLSPPFLEDKFF